MGELLVSDKVSDLVPGKLDVLKVQDLADFQRFGARGQDLGEFSALLGVDTGAPEDSLATELAVLKVWRECKSWLSNVATQRGSAKTDKEDDSEPESSDDEPDVNLRRTLLGEFRKRHRFNLPMHHQVSDRLLKKMVK